MATPQALFDALPQHYLEHLKSKKLKAEDFPCFECPWIQDCDCDGLRYDLYNLDTMAGIDCLAAK